MQWNLTTPLTLLTLAAALAFTTACGSSVRNGGRPADVPLAAGIPTTVTIDNQLPSDMRVYVVAGGAEHRLGLVSALSTATFRIPSVIPSGSDLRFRAVPLAGGEPQSTDMITAFAGNSIAFTIGHGPATSSLSLRR